MAKQSKSKEEEKPSKKKTKKMASFIDDFKGSKVFGIWNIDEDGEKEGDYPVVAFGKPKARAILNFLEEMQEFANDD